MRDQDSLRASIPRLGAAARQIAEDPITTIAWLAALLIAVVLAPVWGSAFVIMGWLGARLRMRKEGLTGLGDALAPSLARQQYKDGVWRGIWRTQSLGLAFTLVQLPTTLLAFVPAAIVFGLFSTASIPGEMGLVIGYVIPGLVALACAVVVLAQNITAYRILAVSGPKYTLGLVFGAVGEAWKLTLSQARLLVGLTAGLLLTAIAGGVLVGLSAKLAEVMQLGMRQLVVITWTGGLVAVFFSGLVLESLASWSDELEIEPIRAQAPFSFSAWLTAWLTWAVKWLSEQGVISVGLVACLVIGVLTSMVALVTGKNFESWFGLGWFAVTAAVLVILNRQRSHAS